MQLFDLTLISVGVKTKPSERDEMFMRRNGITVGNIVCVEFTVVTWKGGYGRYGYTYTEWPSGVDKNRCPVTEIELQPFSDLLLAKH